MGNETILALRGEREKDLPAQKSTERNIHSAGQKPLLRFFVTYACSKLHFIDFGIHPI